MSTFTGPQIPLQVELGQSQIDFCNGQPVLNLGLTLQLSINKLIEALLSYQHHFECKVEEEEGTLSAQSKTSGYPYQLESLPHTQSEAYPSRNSHRRKEPQPKLLEPEQAEQPQPEQIQSQPKQILQHDYAVQENRSVQQEERKDPRSVITERVIQILQRDYAVQENRSGQQEERKDPRSVITERVIAETTNKVAFKRGSWLALDPCGSVHTTHYTLHTTHYTLHTTHYTVRITHYTLHTSHYTLVITHCDLQNYTLQITQRHTNRRTQHTIHYTLHTTYVNSLLF